LVNASAFSAPSTRTLPFNLQTQSDSLTDTVVAAAGAGESDNVCCEYFVTFEEDIAMGNQAEWTQCAVDACGLYK